jgi:hypothetical protein
VDFFSEHSDAFVNLLFGGVLAIVAIADFPKYKDSSRFGLAVQLLAGVALAAFGLLNLTGHVPDVWGKVSYNGALGVLFVMWGTTGKFFGTSAVRVAKWAETLAVVCGVIMILLALSWGLDAYYY